MKFAVRKRRAPSIIIVSLVDILTILLIFFVVSTTFKKDQPEVEINLPESKTSTSKPAELEHAIVSVDANDALKLDGKAIAVDDLQEAITNLPPARKSTLVLKADEKASFGIIIKVMDALKLAGVKNLPAFTQTHGNEVADRSLRQSRLAAKGKRIAAVDERIRELAANMIETMHEANGIGLAAQQVGEALQLTVIDIAGAEDQESTMKLNGTEVEPKASMPLVLLNPELTLGQETGIGVEGCLSFPEITGDIRRAISVIMLAETLEGGTVQIEASGLLARALQHEVDHLNGILFIDRMSAATKVALRSRLKRMQRETMQSLGVEALKR